MIEKRKTELDARQDAKDLFRIRNEANETAFLDLAYSMLMQRFHLGVCAALDKSRSILGDPEKP